jgi:hypothetical protein
MVTTKQHLARQAQRLRECAILLEPSGVGNGVQVPVTEAPPSLVRISGSTFSLRVIAAAIILLFCYYAQGVVITLLLSILLAYFLDPAVELLERVHIPRTVGAMTMVLILIAVLVAVGYGLGERTAEAGGEHYRRQNQRIRRPRLRDRARNERRARRSASRAGHSAHADCAKHRISICVVLGSDVRALPRVFYAGGET